MPCLKPTVRLPRCVQRQQRSVPPLGNVGFGEHFRFTH